MKKRLIDANKAKFFIADILDTFNVPVGDRMAERLIRAIDALPTEDAVEVVRCKDCKHFGMYEFGDGSDGAQPACLTIEYDGFVRFATSVEPDHFCSHGERRTKNA